MKQAGENSLANQFVAPYFQIVPKDDRPFVADEEEPAVIAWEHEQALAVEPRAAKYLGNVTAILFPANRHTQKP